MGRRRGRGDPLDHYRGRSALVTGAASGIGKALATELVARGARVALCDIDGDRVDAVAEDLSARHGTGGRSVATARAVDVRDPGAVATTIDAFAEEQGGLDFLFNNAGIPIGGEARELGVDHWRRAVEVNLMGVIHGIAAAYPRMVAAGSGHIVNTASLAGLVPSPLLVPYSTTKHAVVGLSTGLRMEAAPHGVRVSVVCPGLVETPLLDRANPDDLPQVTSAPDIRAMLTQLMGAPYPPGALARDVLIGVARNRAMIVTPRRARLVWAVARISPSLLTEHGGRALPATDTTDVPA